MGGDLIYGQETIMLDEDFETFCYTKGNYPNFMENLSPDFYSTASLGGDDLFVNMYIHIIRRNDGTGGRNPEDIADGLAALHDAYSPHHIFFNVLCVDYIDNTTLYNSSFGDCTDNLPDCPYNAVAINNDGLDVFILDENAPFWSAGGIVDAIPGSAMVLGGTWLVNNDGFGEPVTPVDVLQSHVFSHEVGHCLGLYHTHHGTVDEGASGEPTDIPCAELAVQPTDPTDLNFGNCFYCGDYVCDTEAGAIIVATVPDCIDVIAGGITSTSPITSAFTDTQGNPFPYTQLDNIMSYVELTCQETITAQQGFRARYYLQSHPLLTPMLVPEDTGIATSVIIDGETITTGEPVIWDSPTLVTNDIIVPNGATLEINSTTIQFMGTLTGIKVETGGILHINNSTLEAAGCSDYWAGISVEGNRNVYHPVDYYFSGSTDHGVVIIENDSFLKDALIGINAYDTFDVLGTDVGGGIVHAEGNTFENNMTAIKIERFYGENPSGIVMPSQRGRIRNNNFINSAPFMSGGADLGNYRHIVLNRCQTILIKGNTFRTTTADLVGEEKGVGIIAYNTDTKIGVLSADEDQYSNTFDNLSQGIDLFNTLTAISVTNVVQNEFINVDRGLTLNSIPFGTYKRNKFEVPAGNDINGDTYAIFAANSFGFEISENKINTTANTLLTNGIVVDDTFFGGLAGLSNRSLIHDNTFEGTFNASVFMIDNNNFLQLYCNAYIGAARSDWFLAPNSFLQEQGQCVSTNPNEAFSTHWHNIGTPITPSYDRLHINNQSTNPVILYCDSGSQPNPTYSFGNITVVDCSEGVESFTRDCIIDYPEDEDDLEGLTNCQGDIGRKVRNHLAFNRKQSVINMLECVDKVWTDKLLVGTFIDQQNYTAAINRLDMIPDDTQENLDYKSISYAYINERTGGSGKKGFTTTDIKMLADAKQANNQVFAQSMLASLNEASYRRSVGSYQQTELNGLSAIDPSFTLYPNPTSSYVNIDLSAISTASFEGQQVLIYNLTGKLLQTHNLTSATVQRIPISKLKIGIYYCQISGTKEVQKLIIVR